MARTRVAAYDGVESDPSIATVEGPLSAVREHRAELFVAAGGGSPTERRGRAAVALDVEPDGRDRIALPEGAVEAGQRRIAAYVGLPSGYGAAGGSEDLEEL